MAQIIYEKNTGELIPQGDRSVSTFPSGLIRVDQTFICSTPNVSTHRSDLKVGNDFPGGSDPAIDGLYIYPEVQEKRRGDGFSELIASGYGRTITSLQDIRKQVNTFIQSRTIYEPASYFVEFYVTTNTINGFIVIKNGEPLGVDDLGLDEQLFIPYNLIQNDDNESLVITSTEFNYKNAPYIDWNGDVRNVYYNRIDFYSTQWGPEISYYYTWASPRINIINSQNYGEFTELEISVR